MRQIEYCILQPLQQADKNIFYERSTENFV